MNVILILPLGIIDHNLNYIKIVERNVYFHCVPFNISISIINHMKKFIDLLNFKGESI